MEIRALDDATLLETRERCGALPRPWRELLLLAAACDAPPERLARLPIGERDRALLTLLESTVGSRLECETDCRACGARLEFTLDAGALQQPSQATDPAAFELASEAGERLTIRLPDSLDVGAAIDAGRSGQEPAAVIAMRCTGRPTGDRSTPPLTAGTVALISARMAELDPQAELQLDLDCPECGERWQDVFDPGAYLLGEVETRADLLVEEVHLLARAYGWRESDTLAVGHARRQRYIELAAG